MVRPKKHLGQHFLKDDNICRKIAEAIEFHEGYKALLEVGPGMGALTKFLLLLDAKVEVIEIDTESVAYLNTHYPDLKVHNVDFLKTDLAEISDEQFGLVGNFPYNISSQILFKVLENRHLIPEVVGMFQKEVAERVCIGPGSKQYGILSVLVQAFYDAEYIYTVSEHVFDPPPKVKSGILRLKRKEKYKLDCDEELFFKVVKAGFNQRRKTLRNSLRSAGITEVPEEFSGKRPEQLGWEEFVALVGRVISRE